MPAPVQSDSEFKNITDSISFYVQQLRNHPLYNNIKSIDDLRLFTTYHVYSVWDFMSLLKAIQAKLTCVSIPWFPTEYPEIRRFINEIVLAEESDNTLDGSVLSHLELYIKGMEECGAETRDFINFIERLKRELNENSDIILLIRSENFDPRLKDYLEFTFKLINDGEIHDIVAAFTFGRELLIPEMFNSIIHNLQAQCKDVDIKTLIYYFERHIDLDGDEHGPAAQSMIKSLCKNDPKLWQSVEKTSIEALKLRIGLWDAINDSLQISSHNNFCKRL